MEKQQNKRVSPTNSNFFGAVAAVQWAAVFRFLCNICGRPAECPEQLLDREIPSCGGCGSTVRFRAIVHLLSRELFGESIPLSEFPPLEFLQAIGMSDWHGYAGPLEKVFDYANTYLHREPKFDITAAAAEPGNQYDFLIAADVFEHVAQPVEKAFAEVHRLLKPCGFLLMTVPYALEAKTREHFPNLHEFTLAEISGQPVLVNRTAEGVYEVHDGLVFHGGQGASLEMRVFSEAPLEAQLLRAGFREVEFLRESYLRYGIVFEQKWSLPLIARKEPFAFPKRSVLALGEHLRQSRQAADAGEKARAAAETELEGRTDWAQSLDAELSVARQKLAQLDAELEERTRWAQALDQECQAKDETIRDLQQSAARLRAQIAQAETSSWLSLGRRIGIGPRFNHE
jgi:SAM-dependent methyltransferase